MDTNHETPPLPPGTCKDLEGRTPEELWNKKNVFCARKTPSVFIETQRTRSSGVVYWDIQDKELKVATHNRIKKYVSRNFTQKVRY